jgi:dynein heavy chain
VATQGSVLYFVVLELPGIDTMYQYSLEFFKGIFKRVLATTDSCGDVAARCTVFIDRLMRPANGHSEELLWCSERLIECVDMVKLCISGLLSRLRIERAQTKS